MRAIEVAGSFGLENLQLSEREPPQPGPGEVALEIGAASLNFRDLLVVEGKYNPKQPLPLVPCSDGAGRVIAAGAGVEGWRVGDRAMAAFAPWWTAGPPAQATIRKTLGSPLDGALRERMVVPADGLVPTPDQLTDVEAATLPCAGVTAWRALFSLGELRPGQTVLCLGTGGVSIFALQLAKAAGARVIVTSSSDEKLERARALGADETLNYKAEPRWGKAVRTLSDGGVDLVVEVGGAGTLTESIRATKPGGTVALIGVLAGGGAPDLTPVLMSQIRVQGVYVGPVSDLAALARAMTTTGVRPVVEQTFPLEEAKAAFEALKSQAHLGKIAITVGGE